MRVRMNTNDNTLNRLRFYALSSCGLPQSGQRLSAGYTYSISLAAEWWLDLQELRYLVGHDCK